MILHFWQFQKIVFDYYNTILHYSDHIFAMFISYGVENQIIFRPGGEGNQRPGGKEIKRRSTLYTPVYIAVIMICPFHHL